jgi:predicted phosphodiesterase
MLDRPTDAPGIVGTNDLNIWFEPKKLAGLLFIGDPHIEGRTPGFRRDNYPETILNKLTWCIQFAEQHDLQPVLLGDIFDKPRDNPNWIIARLLDLFGTKNIPAIFGNHDCANPQLDENDSLTLLAKAGGVYLMDADHVWCSQIDGRIVMLGGSPYRYAIPDAWLPSNRNRKVTTNRNSLVDQALQPSGLVEESWQTATAKPDLTVWITHHDLVFPNPHEAVVTKMYEIPGIDFLINGHIHRRASSEVVRGQTTWINPGNIARRSRADTTRGHVPSVLRMDVGSDGQWLHTIQVPHQPATDVFFDLNAAGHDVEASSMQSSFITGLSMLQSRKTDSGAGLMQFLRENVTQFDTEVAEEIMDLANQVVEQHVV